MIFFIIQLIKPVQFINHFIAHQKLFNMNNENNQLNTYQAILAKRNQYEKLLQRYRQQAKDFKRQVVREKCMNQILMSNQYTYLRNDSLYKAEQFGLVRQTHIDTSQNNQANAQKIAKQALNNQTLQNRVEQLQDQIEIQKLRSQRLQKQLLAYQNYLDNLIGRKNKSAKQIREVVAPQPSQMEALLKQKLMAQMTSESNNSGSIINQNDFYLIQKGQFYVYIQLQIMKIKEMCSKTKSLQLILPEKYNQYKHLKEESQLSKKTFAHYSYSQQMEKVEDLLAHQERIDSEIRELLIQIDNETAKEENISSNCEQIARRQAKSNAKQFALNKQKEVERKRKMVIELLPFIVSTDATVIDQLRILQEELLTLQAEESNIKNTLFTGQAEN